MKANKLSRMLIIFIVMGGISTFFLTKPYAEKSGSSPESGVDSVLKDTYNYAVDLNVGEETGV